MSKEHQVSSSEEGTVTIKTKTTRITQQKVTTETQPGDSSTTPTTAHQVPDFNYWGCCNDTLNVFYFLFFFGEVAVFFYAKPATWQTLIK